MKKLLITAALAASAALPAHAAATLTNVGCSFSDLTGVTVSACSGFYSGNLLQGGTGSDADADVETALQALGLSPAVTSTLKYVEKIGNNNGAFTVNFNTLLKGDTVVGIHFGNGSKVFKDASPDYNGKGGGTAFYRFNANNVDIFGLASYLTSSSGVAVFQTGLTAPIPEPETYALMAAGLGVVGFIARRRKKA